MTNNFKVGVVAGGAVGQAVAAYYPEVKIFDKYKPLDPIEEVAAADYIFVAVPTPYKDGLDLFEMDDAIANIAVHLKDPATQIVIIKSTVLPGTTERYQEKYPEVNFIFNPEFLTERTAIEDFAKPDKQLVGVTTKTKELAPKVLEILPSAPFQKIMPAAAAELAKYAINSYYGFKVIFGNSLFDYCEKVGADYDMVREGLTNDKRIVDSHFDVFHGGQRGYQGKCLPKDIKTLVWFAKKHGVAMELLDSVIAINERLTGIKV